MLNEPRSISIPRHQLYEQVWSQPMTLLARQYGISDVALAKICRKLGVHYPGRGYWRKKETGKVVKQIPLLPSADPLASLQRALNTRLAWRGDAKPEGRKVGPLCLLAVPWCKRKDFQDWLFETFVEESGVAPVGEAEDRARSVICSVCGVESRADLYSDRDAASRFNSSIRVPFKERLELAELA